MRFIKRLMEIKEEQLWHEEQQRIFMAKMDETMTNILKELKGIGYFYDLKGGTEEKNGNNNNSKHRVKA